MKKIIAAAVFTIVAAFAISKVGALPGDHDFTTAYNGVGGSYTASAGPDQACNTCHTPHNAIKAVSLWDRNAPAGPFTMFGTGADWLAGNSADFLGSKSGMCLSCHDGVTVIGSGVTMAAGGANFGTNLSDDHPVGVEYPATGDFTAKASINLPLETINAKDYVSCASCHDPHSSNSKMLRLTTGLCLDCHTK